MSLAFPEGECFFNRSALRTSTYDLRTACIRAIYIPVAQEAGEDYPEICTFLQVNFAVEREVRMMAHAEINDWENRRYIVVDREETCKLDTTLGLTNDAAWCLAINIPKLVNLLSLPRQFRKHNCFSSRSIILVDRKLTPTKGPAQVFSSSADLSWLTIAKANYGLSLQWQPPQPTDWLAGFLKNTLTVAVGFIPIVGPIAAVCFPLAWTAVAEPDALLKTMRDLIPVSDLAMKVVEEIRKSAQEQEAYLPKGWSAFRLSAAVPQGEAATGGAQAKAEAPSEPIKKQDDAAQKAREATVKKFESIRKFKYWNVMKSAPPSATSTEVTKQAEEPDIPPQQAVQVASVPEAPPKPSLDDLKPSTTFQLAGQILLHSGDTSNVTGTEDDTMGGTIEEVFPETSTSPEDSDFNWYDWMEEYLAEEFSLATDEQMEE